MPPRASRDSSIVELLLTNPHPQPVTSVATPSRRQAHHTQPASSAGNARHQPAYGGAWGYKPHTTAARSLVACARAGLVRGAPVTHPDMLREDPKSESLTMPDTLTCR
jgi:hypothetical protein